LPTAIKQTNASEAQRVIEAVASCREAGATWVFAGLPHPSRAALLENFAWFGEEVIGKTR
jgi:hypothetical protein